jgi:autotransporter-associated beta strand protein
MSGANALNLPITVTGTLAASVSATSTRLIVAGAISGSGALTKTGGGVLTLAGSVANTYTGLSTVTAGTLELAKTGGAVAVAGNLTIGGGSLARELSSNQIADTSGVTVNNTDARFDLDGVTDTIGALTVNGPGPARVNIGTGTLLAGPVTMTGGTISSTSPGSLNLQGDVTIDTTFPAQIVGDVLNLGGATRTITVAGLPFNSSLGIFAVVVNGGLTKAGAGMLTLAGSASNTYTGVTTVSAGTLSLNKSAGSVAVGGNLTVSGGTAIEAAFGNQIDNASTVTVNGGGTFDLNGQTDTVGPLTVNGGSVTIGTGTLTAGPVTMTGGSITSTGAGKLVQHGDVTTNAASSTASISGNLDLGGVVRTFTVADSEIGPELDIPAAISDGGVVKAGAGTLLFSGSSANLYSGPTTVSAGLLELAKTGGALAVPGNLTIISGDASINGGVALEGLNDQIADTSIVTVNFGGAFNLNGAIDAIGPLTVSGGSVIIGAGTLRTGTLEMTGGSIASNGAGKFVPAAILTNAAPAPATISGKLDLDGFGHGYAVADGDANPDLDISAAISNGILVKSGAGTLRFSGMLSNTYGSTTVSAGTLELAKTGGATSLAGPVTVGDGSGGPNADVLRLLADNQIADSVRVGVTSSGLLTLNNFAETVAGLDLFTGDSSNAQVAIAQTGRMTLGGNVSVSPAAGTTGASGAIITGNLSLGGATRTFDVADGAAGFDLEVFALISGTGSEGLIKTGTGTMRLEAFASNTYTGPTTVSAGTLRLENSGVAVPGALAIAGGTVSEERSNQIGDTAAVTLNSGGLLKLNGLADTVGTLTVAGGTLSTGGFSAGRLTAGNTSFDAASTLAMKLVDATNSDRLFVHGTLAVGGTLQLSLSSPVAIGTTITLIDNDGTDAVTGTFAGLPQGATILAGGQLFAISYAGGDGNDIVLVATATPVITGQPASQTVNEGNPVTFTASASGVPTPTVQWQVSTNGGASFSDISAATNPSLTFTTAFSQNGNLFRAVFSNSAGSVNTTAATLTVIGKPTVVSFTLDVPRDTLRPLTLQGSDPANRPLTFIVTAPPQHGTLTGTAPNLTYTPAAGYVGPDSLQYKANNGILDSNPGNIFINVSAAGGAVQSVTIDNGTAQRSMVRSLTVTFSGSVNFAGAAANAFQLARTGGGNVTLAVDLSGSTVTQTIARLTFSGSLTEGANSLVDGDYTLTVVSGQINGGLPGGDQVTALHRLFGDVNGDKTVNITDLTAFRNSFGATTSDANYQPFLDLNGDGVINLTDLTQFRNRFGVILP